MPNQINAQGITIQTIEEILDELINGTASVPGLKAIYGEDINLDSNSPDGQLANIFALSKQDILNFIVQDYVSKDPDQAIGVALDGVAQLCGITRKGGTYTTTEIVITASQSLNLNGQDTTIPYTVADSNGNQFQLIASASLTIGDNTLLFQSVNIGAVLISPNTITVPVSIVAGVTAINNPNAPTQVGLDQESDALFRIRRQKSVAKPAQGFLQGLYPALLDLSGVNSAAVFENYTSVTDGYGQPPHSIWVVTDGGDPDAIASLIYLYRNAGCGMYGSQSIPVLQIDGTLFNAAFDFAGTENLQIRCHVDSINGGVVDQNAISQAIIEGLNFGINDPADVTEISNVVSASNPNLVVSQIAVSADGIAWSNVVFPISRKDKFSLLTSNITYL